MVIPKINSGHGSDTRNIINRAIDSINTQGKTIQDLVAEGQLTPEQFAEMMKELNGLISKGNVSPSDIDKSLGKFDASYFSEKFLQELRDGTIEVTNVLPNSITTSLLTRHSVIPEKTSFLELSSNKFNHNTVSEGYIIDRETGLLTSGSEYMGTSDFITALPETRYRIRDSEFVAFYNENGDYLSFLERSGLSDFTTPTGTYLMRFVTPLVRVGTSTQLNEGGTLLPFELYHPPLLKEVDLPVNSVTNRELGYGSVSTDNTNFIEVSTNLFDKNTVDLGMSINLTASSPLYGKLVKNSSYATSDFIDVVVGEQYSYDGVRVVYFDSEGDIAPHITTTEKTFTVREGTSKIKFVFPVNDVDVARFNRGSVLLPYEPHFVKIVGKNIVNADTSKDVSNEDYYVENNLTSYIYSAPEMESAADNTSNSIEQKTASEIYTLYDALLSSSDKKTKIADDHSGNPLYKYHFKPNYTTPIAGTGEKPDNLRKPKIVLVGGIHGNEKASVWVLYQAIKQITENWKNDTILESLKWDVELIVIPIANPSGWNAGTRKNSNGVDLNRNFPKDWMEFDVDHTTYGGTHPLSEPESIAINNVIEGEKNIIYLCDFHNFSANAPYFLWNAGGSNFNINLGESFVSTMSRKWKKDITGLEGDGVPNYGYVSETPLASLALYAPTKGIHASTFEISHTFITESERYNGESIKRGVESFINWLSLNLKNNIKI